MKSLRGRRDDLEGFGKRGGENGFRGKRFLDAATMNSRSRSCGNSVASLTLTVQQVCSLNQYPARLMERRMQSNQEPLSPCKR